MGLKVCNNIVFIRYIAMCVMFLESDQWEFFFIPTGLIAYRFFFCMCAQGKCQIPSNTLQSFLLNVGLGTILQKHSLLQYYYIKLYYTYQVQVYLNTTQY